MKKIAALVLGLGIVAGCGGSSDYADEMAREHADDAPVSNEASEASPAVDVGAETVTYATLESGEPAAGYLARPAGVEEALPGIIVIHEWWGLNDNIRSMAEHLKS